MCTPFKDHVAPLDKPLIHELVAMFGCFSWLSSASEEDASLLILDTHEVGGDLDVDDVGPVAVSLEIVHEQIVGVVDEEVQGVHHLPVVANEGHLDGLLHDLADGLSGLLFLREQFDLPLLFGLLD